MTETIEITSQNDLDAMCVLAKRDGLRINTKLQFISRLGAWPCVVSSPEFTAEFIAEFEEQTCLDGRRKSLSHEN